ncbi:MAG: hypothetical protein LQ338_002883 [Usnochroma carphineum]|nr:MAG: hypothetical protein LQ338_002883 [Usnochroma carphineum]
MSDLNDFHEMFSDDAVMQYWSTPPHTELSQTEEDLGNMVHSSWNGKCDFVLEYSPSSGTSKVIGKLGLWDGHEIGFMLNRDFWGKGLMKEAMHQFFRDLWISEDMQALQDVVADVDPRNSACIFLLKKFGFKEAGYRVRTWETHLGWCDSLDLVLKRPAKLQE